MFRRVLAPDLESVCGSPFGCQACDQRRPGAAILPGVNTKNIAIFFFFAVFFFYKRTRSLPGRSTLICKTTERKGLEMCSHHTGFIPLRVCLSPAALKAAMLWRQMKIGQKRAFRWQSLIDNTLLTYTLYNLYKYAISVVSSRIHYMWHAMEHKCNTSQCCASHAIKYWLVTFLYIVLHVTHYRVSDVTCYNQYTTGKTIENL